MLLSGVNLCVVELKEKALKACFSICDACCFVLDVSAGTLIMVPSPLHIWGLREFLLFHILGLED